MKPVHKILIVLMLAMTPVVALHAQGKDAALSDAQKTAVENVVRELLLKKEPELIVKAAQEMQARMEKEQNTKSNENIVANKSKLFNDADAPVAGNAKGDVTIVEFFDYQCGYCKMVQPTVEKILSDDKNVRFIYKELPILGPVSQFASKAALASVAQGKYFAFHNAMMEKKERLSEDSIMDIAKEIGLNVEKLKTDMQSAKVEKQIKANIELADQIGARGTPAFVIGERLYPGAMQADQMAEIISDLRKAKK